jgi:hypothetical protein
MKRAFVLGLAVTVVLACCSKPASTGAGGPSSPEGGPFGAACGKFQAAFAAKDYALALTDLRAILQTFWMEAPLMLGNAHFVKGPDNSYGIFEPHGGEVFTEGEPIYLYMEPTGYAIVENPAGYFEFGFKADFQVTDENGQVLGGQKDFAAMPFRSWNRNTEISLTFTYTVSGLDKGRYKIITVVADAHSEKRATIEKPFVIQ